MEKQYREEGVAGIISNRLDRIIDKIYGDGKKLIGVGTLLLIIGGGAYLNQWIKERLHEEGKNSVHSMAVENYLEKTINYLDFEKDK